MKFSRFFKNYDRLIIFNIVMPVLVLAFRYHPIMPFLLIVWVVGSFYLSGGGLD